MGGEASLTVAILGRAEIGQEFISSLRQSAAGDIRWQDQTVVNAEPYKIGQDWAFPSEANAVILILDSSDEHTLEDFGVMHDRRGPLVVAFRETGYIMAALGHLSRLPNHGYHHTVTDPVPQLVAWLEALIAEDDGS